jgi:hypothetical protein
MLIRFGSKLISKLGIKVAFFTLLVVTAFSLSASAWWSRKAAISQQDITAAQPTPTPNLSGYIQRGFLRSRLRDAARVLGDRLEKPGKERLTLVGTLRRPGNPGAVPFRLFQEFPRRMRLEEQGSQPRVTGFDGSKGWVLGATPGAADLEVIETLVFDSTDHFFLGQKQGFATRALGTRFRLDDGATPRYAGPFYDLYQVIDRVTIETASRTQSKLFYVNSDTQLFERVRYRLDRGGRGVGVEIRLSNWRKINDQQLPGSIERLENDQPVLTLNIATAIVGPRQNDGIFNAP